LRVKEKEEALKEKTIEMKVEASAANAMKAVEKEMKYE